MASNNTYFSYSCFSSVKTAEREMAAGVNYCGLVKRATRIFFIHVRKVDEILAGRFISCYEDYSNSSFLYTTPGHRVQVQLYEGPRIYCYRLGWKY